MRYVRHPHVYAICLLTAATLLAVMTPFLSAADAPSWAERMALSEMERRGDALSFGKGPQGYWAYETGVFLKGLEALWIETGSVKYYNYLKMTIDSFLESDGTIKTYKLDDFNLDNTSTVGNCCLRFTKKRKRKDTGRWLCY